MRLHWVLPLMPILLAGCGGGGDDDGYAEIDDGGAPPVAADDAQAAGPATPRGPLLETPAALRRATTTL